MEEMRVFTWIVAVLSALAGSSPACDLCAIYSATQAQGEGGKGFFAGFAEQFTHFGTIQIDGEKTSNPAGQFLNSSVSQVFAGYNFTDRIGLQATLPVFDRWYRRTDDMGGIQNGAEAGIGDASLLGNLALYSRNTMATTVRLQLLGGIKFPTGNTQRLKEELDEMDDIVGPPNVVHGHDLTLGSGSYDGIVGASGFFRKGKVFLSGSVQYAIRTEGDYDYRFANDLTWSGGPGAYITMSDDMTFSVQVVVSGEHKGLDTMNGEQMEDTGITSVYLGPQLNFTWTEKLSLQAGVDIPVLLNNTSQQIVPDYRVRVGFTWRF